jgi:hypothetical protein
MIFLIEPTEVMLPVCPRRGCQTYCGIKPLYGVPDPEI